MLYFYTFNPYIFKEEIVTSVCGYAGSLGYSVQFRDMIIYGEQVMFDVENEVQQCDVKHLREVQQTCEKRMELLMAELLVKNPAPDKATQQFAWVVHMNSLKAGAEELVILELIYN